MPDRFAPRSSRLDDRVTPSAVSLDPTFGTAGRTTLTNRAALDAGVSVECPRQWAGAKRVTQF